MANIDIAERLFTYAREKQRSDLANNLIKQEDIIDFSEGDFTSFNDEISAMLVGLDNEQINMFFSLLQNKISDNLQDVITPNERGFSLNMPSIVSTINQVVKQSNQTNKTLSKIDELKEISKENLMISQRMNDLEKLSKFGEVSDLFKKFYLTSNENLLNQWNQFSAEEQHSLWEESMRMLGVTISNDPSEGKDLLDTTKKLFQIDDETLNNGTITSEDSFKEPLSPDQKLLGDLLSKFSTSDKEFVDIIMARFMAAFYHGNFFIPGSNGQIDFRSIDAFFDSTIAGMAKDSPLYEFMEPLKNQIKANIPSVAKEFINNPKYAENMITKDFLIKNSNPYDITYNIIDEKEKIPLKISSMLRRSMNINGNLPDEIQKRIEEFVNSSIIQDPHDLSYHFKEPLDFNEIKKAFTFDPEKDKDMILELGKKGHVLSTSDYSKVMEKGLEYLNTLPEAMASVVASSNRASKIIDDLKYNVEDVKSIKPLLENFSTSKIDIDDEMLCDIINDCTQRDSSYTHVNVEKLLQAITLLSKNFEPNAENYEFKSSLLTAKLNNISFERLDKYKDEMPFIDFDELQDLDINHWSSKDLKYDDVQDFLGDTKEQIRKTRAYKKLFPSTVALDCGFRYDFDAYLLKISSFDAKTQLDILSNPEKDSSFLTFAAALSMLYRDRDNNNISSTIDKRQQEINLEILKSEFLENFDKSSLDNITVESMAPIIDILITNKNLPPLATSLATHIDLRHFAKYDSIINDGKISFDYKHPGFFTPESYQFYNAEKNKNSVAKETSTIDVSQPEDSKIDNHPIEKKKPRGLIGFISSFINKFRNTDKESGIFNRLKESFNYARNDISEYSDTDVENINKEEDFKPSQNTNSNKPAELDSFYQSLRNEYNDVINTTPNNDGKNTSAVQKNSSDGRANSDDHDEIDM